DLCFLAPPIQQTIKMDQEDGGFNSMGAVSIIGAEDEDFENDIEPNVDDQQSYFQSIELVKDHPAYIMVFLHHVVLQFDPSPLLCFLHVEILRSLSAKEGKKSFTDFYNTFLMKGAVSIRYKSQRWFYASQFRVTCPLNWVSSCSGPL
ncbi:unnamed protein product, partial [Ranitomeya imitator]